jgi:hypothetical protein
MDQDRKVTESMLQDILWIGQVLKEMGQGFDKRITTEMIHRSKEFICGALYERARIRRSLEAGYREQYGD